MSRRPLTPEEQRLWRAFTADVTRFDTGAEALEQTQPWLPEQRISTSAPQSDALSSPVSPGRKQQKSVSPALEFPPAFDGHTAQRIKRGQWQAEATLDLHGHTQESAFRALGEFLHRARQQGQRRLRIITGYGKSAGKPGVLQQKLPHWLEAPEYRDFIAAWDLAPPPQGGQGVYLLLLRKSALLSPR